MPEDDLELEQTGPTCVAWAKYKWALPEGKLRAKALKFLYDDFGPTQASGSPAFKAHMCWAPSGSDGATPELREYVCFENMALYKSAMAGKDATFTPKSLDAKWAYFVKSGLGYTPVQKAGITEAEFTHAMDSYQCKFIAPSVYATSTFSYPPGAYAKIEAKKLFNKTLALRAKQMEALYICPQADGKVVQYCQFKYQDQFNKYASISKWMPKHEYSDWLGAGITEAPSAKAGIQPWLMSPAGFDKAIKGKGCKKIE